MNDFIPVLIIIILIISFYVWYFGFNDLNSMSVCSPLDKSSFCPCSKEEVENQDVLEKNTKYKGAIDYSNEFIIKKDEHIYDLDDIDSKITKNSMTRDPRKSIFKHNLNTSLNKILKEETEANDRLEWWGQNDY